MAAKVAKLEKELANAKKAAAQENVAQPLWADDTQLQAQLCEAEEQVQMLRKREAALAEGLEQKRLEVQDVQKWLAWAFGMSLL